MTSRVLRSIPQTIGSVRTVHDIPKITEWTNDLRKQFSPSNVAGYCQMQFTPVQYATLAFTVPTHYDPEQIFIICKKTLKILSELEPKYQTGLMLIFARASFLSKHEDECLEIMKTFNEVDPLIFLPPYLYLAAMCKKPVAIIPPLIIHRRTYAFSLYYAGINHLLLYKLDDAFKLLLHCLHIPCQNDMIPGAVKALSLVCFLDHKSKKQFLGVLPPKAELDPLCTSLWEGRKTLDQSKFENYQIYLHFWNEICTERLNRNIIFCARTISQLSMSKLKDLCACFDQNKLLEQMSKLMENGIIKYNIIDEKTIVFEKLEKYPNLDEAIETAETLLVAVQHINWTSE